MKAIILARVSTEEQKEVGNSLPAQQERLRLYINRKPDFKLQDLRTEHFNIMPDLISA